MTIRTAKDALAAAYKQTTNRVGTCQLVTRGWFNSPSVGDIDGDGDADAIDGWASEPKKYQVPGDRNPPAGAPLAFRNVNKNGFGHRCIATGKGSGVRSTDTLTSTGRYNPGTVGDSTIEKLESSMGLVYLGWSRSIGGEPIKDLQPTPPKPKPKTSRGVYVDAALKSMQKVTARTPERKKLKEKVIADLKKFPLIK